jgi:phosphoadenosine phosphosulfate reductase
MTVSQTTLPGFGASLEERVDRSILLLRAHQPPGGYYGCFSGGKDSCVIKHLATAADVEVHWTYNQTTIDPPELIRFIRDKHSDVRWSKPAHGNFFRRVEEKGHIPTRRIRWCCDEYKEKRCPRGEVMLMGLRAEESPSRLRGWMEVGTHRRTNRAVVLPIRDWASDELWAYIRERGIDVCSLYDEGFHRLGCIGCPLPGRNIREKEFARWPRFERLWKRSFRRVWRRKAGTNQGDGREWFGSALFSCWEEMWEWWMDGRGLPTRRIEQTLL